MSNYIDLVLAKGTKESEELNLFRAPAFSSLKKDSHIICEDFEGYVVDTLSVNPESEYFRFIVTATLGEGTTIDDIIPVKYKVEYSLLEYPDDENKEEE